MIEDLLWQSLNQAVAEKTGREIKQFLTQTKQRDKKLVKHLKDNGADASSIQLFKNMLNAENLIKEKKIPKDFYLDTAVEAYTGLDSGHFSELKASTQQLNKEIAALEESRLHFGRMLSTIPEQAVIAEIQQKLRKSQTAIVQEQAKNSILQDQLMLVQRQTVQAEIRLGNLKLADNKNAFDAELDRNIVGNIDSIKLVIEKFHHAMVEKHIKHLESLIFDSFMSLIRKSKLVKHITIEPKTYKLSLFDQQLEAIPSNRLSAGERQILAISILWG